jgi:hypothetical protein
MPNHQPVGPHHGSTVGIDGLGHLVNRLGAAQPPGEVSQRVEPATRPYVFGHVDQCRSGLTGIFVSAPGSQEFRGQGGQLVEQAGIIVVPTANVGVHHAHRAQHLALWRTQRHSGPGRHPHRFDGRVVHRAFVQTDVVHQQRFAQPDDVLAERFRHGALPPGRIGDVHTSAGLPKRTLLVDEGHKPEGSLEKSGCHQGDSIERRLGLRVEHAGRTNRSGAARVGHPFGHPRNELLQRLGADTSHPPQRRRNRSGDRQPRSAVNVPEWPPSIPPASPACQLPTPRRSPPQSLQRCRLQRPGCEAPDHRPPS